MKLNVLIICGAMFVVNDAQGVEKPLIQGIVNSSKAKLRVSGTGSSTPVIINPGEEKIFDEKNADEFKKTFSFLYRIHGAWDGDKITFEFLEGDKVISTFYLQTFDNGNGFKYWGIRENLREGQPGEVKPISADVLVKMEGTDVNDAHLIRIG